MASQMLGGLSETKIADEKIQKLCDTVRPKAEEKAGKTFAEFTAVSFREQSVSGTNYFIKVRVGEEEYAHLRIYKPLPCDGKPIELSGMQHPKTLEDKIVYFQLDPKPNQTKHQCPQGSVS